jgi:general secretion pathway protein G
MNIKYKVNTWSLDKMKIKGILNLKLGLEFERKSLNGFTLVELMVVVAVIGVLAGIVLAAAGGVQKKAARDQTKAEIKTICVALENFKASTGAYPTNTGNYSTNFYASLTNILSFKTNQITGSGTNLSLLDPYGYPYRYRSPAQSSSSMLSESFEIWSTGPNGKSDFDSGATNAGANSLDDITSWQ